MRGCIFILVLTIFLTACSSAAKVEHNPAAAALNARLGVAYLEQHQAAFARQKFLLAFSQNPNDPEINDVFAYYLEQSGEIQQAKKYYLRSISLAEHKGASLNNYGTFLYRQKQYLDAIRFFLEATKDIYYLTPADAYENAGFAAIQLKKSQLARKYFSMALKLDMSKIKSQQALAKKSLE